MSRDVFTMNSIDIVTHKNNFNHEISLFKIRLHNGFAYMKVGNNFLGGMGVYGPEKIIIVDSNMFLELWKNDSNNSKIMLARGNEAIWRNDYKFHHAEKGFSHGISNPVPLAYVHCYLSEFYEKFSIRLLNYLVGKKHSITKRPYCAFSNGITRTIWLLANGAKCFPAMTDKRSYDLLRLHAGIPESEQLIQTILGASTPS